MTILVCLVVFVLCSYVVSYLFGWIKGPPIPFETRPTLALAVITFVVGFVALFVAVFKVIQWAVG